MWRFLIRCSNAILGHNILICSSVYLASTAARLPYLGNNPATKFSMYAAKYFYMLLSILICSGHLYTSNCCLLAILGQYFRFNCRSLPILQQYFSCNCHVPLSIHENWIPVPSTFVVSSSFSDPCPSLQHKSIQSTQRMFPSTTTINLHGASVQP